MYQTYLKIEDSIEHYDKQHDTKPKIVLISLSRVRSCARVASNQQEIDLDPRYLHLATTDTDFDSLRDDDRFLDLLENLDAGD